VPFKTEWVDIINISETRKGLNCTATRKLDDGSDYYTLPMVRDPTSGKVIGDTFDIANYLEDNFPESGGSLFPKDSTGTGLDYESPNKDSVFYAPVTTNEGAKYAGYASFNTHVDTTFSANMTLYGQFLPFNPETAEAAKALMGKRAHLNSWDDLTILGDARKPLFESFKEALATLAEKFKVHESGPYLEGEKANYADIIVGGWLNMLFALMPKDEWKEFRTWHDGVFGKLHDALQEKYYVLT
jgi:glutathione S-transferase